MVTFVAPPTQPRAATGQNANGPANREAAAAIRRYAERLTPANVKECCMEAEEVVRKSVEENRLPLAFITPKGESETVMRQMHERTLFQSIDTWAQSMQRPDGRTNHPMALMVAQLVAQTLRSAGETRAIYGKTAAQWAKDIQNLVNGVAQAVESFGGNGQGAKQ